MPTLLRRFSLGRTALLAALITLAFVAASTPLHAQNDDEYDSYKLRIDGFWFYSNPSGNFQASGPSTPIDINATLGFNSYSTFAGLVDWHFTHKNHLLFAVSPFEQTRTVVLNRTITFQGKTFTVGTTASADLKANLYAPGYEYDIIRRKRGHLGISAQLDLFDAHASVSAQNQMVNGMTYPAQIGSASLLAPIPVAGPDFRFYLTDSPKLFVEGNLYGMYLFGYGNFLSTVSDLGYSFNNHFSINGGYQLGSRLVVNNNSTTRVGVHLTQQGALAGMEVSF